MGHQTNHSSAMVCHLSEKYVQGPWPRAYTVRSAKETFPFLCCTRRPDRVVLISASTPPATCLPARTKTVQRCAAVAASVACFPVGFLALVTRRQQTSTLTVARRATRQEHRRPNRECSEHERTPLHLGKPEPERRLYRPCPHQVRPAAIVWLCCHCW